MAVLKVCSRRKILIAAAVICALAAGGCSDGEGYVDLRLLSFFPPAVPIYLGSSKVSGIGDVVLRRNVGTVTLNNGGGWSSTAYCQIRIRKNRITTVGVRLANGTARCECEIRAPESTAASTVCQ